MYSLHKRFRVRDICLITVLTAVCVGSNYALMVLPNINIMDLVIFVTGFIFGSSIGGMTGILSWAVYGVLNPLGFSAPILIATMIGESIYGIVGGLVGRISNRKLKNRFDIKFNLEMGLLGLILTIIYDLLTNFVFAVIFRVPIVAAIVSGWLIPPWFGLMHEGSNLLFFFVAVHPLIRAIKMVRGGEKNE